jgi:hypothetical protein
MNKLDIFQSTREKINTFLDFELFDPKEPLDQTERYMCVEDYLIHLSDDQKDIYLDFTLAEANIPNPEDPENEENVIKVFEKIQLSYLDMQSKINWYKEHVIKQTCQLFEEIYMHEDDIQRNIKKIGYLSEIQIVLDEEKFKKSKRK